MKNVMGNYLMRNTLYFLWNIQFFF
uniref:Uncharacterized protein n=1 Tax=Arundo donax TaxID=35708 RepID=A0A0A9AMS7_ARUDO